MTDEKLIAYYDPKTKPGPLEKDIDGMWITREEPHVVIKVWCTDYERPKYSEEPEYIQAYSAFMANKLYEFKPNKK
jgi:hypothetical protein